MSVARITTSTSFFFFFQAEDGIRDVAVTGVQTCALPIYSSTGELTRPRTYGWTRYQVTVWARNTTGASPTSIDCACRYSWSRRVGCVSVRATLTKLSYCGFCQNAMLFELVVRKRSYQSAGSG